MEYTGKRAVKPQYEPKPKRITIKERERLQIRHIPQTISTRKWVVPIGPAKLPINIFIKETVGAVPILRR